MLQRNFYQSPTSQQRPFSHEDQHLADKMIFKNASVGYRLLAAEHEVGHPSLTAFQQVSEIQGTATILLHFWFEVID